MNPRIRASSAEPCPQTSDLAVDTAAPVDREQRISWRMPPLALLTRPTMSTGRRLGLTVLRGYLVIAAGMVVVRIVQLALAQH